MLFPKVISFILMFIGLIGIFRPTILIYLFFSVPVLFFVPHAIADLSMLEIFKIGSINIYLLDYLILILIVVFLKTLLYHRKEFFTILASPISIICILFFFWKLFIGILSYFKGFSLPNVLRQLSIESIIFIVILIPLKSMSEENKKKFFHFGILLGVLLVLFGFLKLSVFHEVAVTSSGTQRLLAANAIEILLLPFCYILFYDEFYNRRPLLSTILFSIFTLCFVFTGSRSGFIVFLFVLMMWFAYSKNKMTFFWFPCWSLALCAIMGGSYFYMNVRTGTMYGDFLVRIDKTLNYKDNSTDDRLEKWQFSLYVLQENPILGLGRFPVYSDSIAHENESLLKSLQTVTTRPPHNMVAAQAMHEGMLGVIILFFLFFIIFHQLRKMVIFDLNHYHFYNIFILSSIIFFMFNTTFDDATGKVCCFTILGFLNEEILKYQTSSPFKVVLP